MKEKDKYKDQERGIPKREAEGKKEGWTPEESPSSLPCSLLPSHKHTESFSSKNVAIDLRIQIANCCVDYSPICND